MAETTKVVATKDWVLPAEDGRPWTDHVPPVIARVFPNRGIDSPSLLTAFMNPELHDPLLLPDMSRACQRLALALSAARLGCLGTST